MQKFNSVLGCNTKLRTWTPANEQNVGQFDGWNELRFFRATAWWKKCYGTYGWAFQIFNRWNPESINAKTVIPTLAKTFSEYGQNDAVAQVTNSKNNAAIDEPRRSTRNRRPPAYLKAYVCERKVDKKAMIRNRYNWVPHPAPNTKWERDTYN